MLNKHGINVARQRLVFKEIDEMRRQISNHAIMTVAMVHLF